MEEENHISICRIRFWDILGPILALKRHQLSCIMHEIENQCNRNEICHNLEEMILMFV